MDNFLIDRETLGRFVDELIKNKTLPVSTAEELNAKREEMIKDLDRRIGIAIFGKFTKEQNEEFNQMLDRPDTTEEDFQNFFDKIGLNIEQITSETMNKFAQELAGGQNE